MKEAASETNESQGLESIASILRRIPIDKEERGRKPEENRSRVTIKFAKDSKSFWDELLGEVVES